MSPVRAHTSLLSWPALAFLIVFMLIPLGTMAYISFLERAPFGGVQWGDYSLVAYEKLVFEKDLLGRMAFNQDYIEIFARSLWLAAGTTLITLVIGFPTAFFMTSLSQRMAAAFLFLVTFPFWTNLLVRNFAWILILRNGGPLENLLAGLGLITSPIDILYTPFATAIGLTYSFLPFMILPIYVALERIERPLIEAAFDLGADRWDTIRRIVLPLAMPGIAAGAILVFVPCLGAYVSPELLGGGKSMMIGNLVQAQFGAARNWPFGAALAVVLVLVMLGALAIVARLRRREVLA